MDDVLRGEREYTLKLSCVYYYLQKDQVAQTTSSSHVKIGASNNLQSLLYLLNRLLQFLTIPGQCCGCSHSVQCGS